MSTFDQPCPHGMPKPASCITCMEDGPVAPPTRDEPEQVVFTTNATYDGHCTRCNLPIIPNERISLLSRSHRWVHQWCAP